MSKKKKSFGSRWNWVIVAFVLGLAVGFLAGTGTIPGFAPPV